MPQRYRAICLAYLTDMLTVYQKSYELPEPDKREILRYAGVRGAADEVETLLDECIAETLSLFRPRVCWCALCINEAKKRYAIRAINYMVKVEGISLEQVHNALETIPANDVAKAKLMACGEKETCIVSVLMRWISEPKHNRMFVPAA